MKRYSASKDINVFVHQLIHQGWHFQRGRVHGKLYHPDGTKWLTVPTTPSDHRAFLNFRQIVRRGSYLD